MSKAKIFLVGEHKDLTPMVETAYPKEEDVQKFLEDYWDLLPGDQIDPDRPRRWLLVKREMGVPGGEEESDRWSLDHLFLDQDGIPTFVECKRASDTAARRKVVAQMLDYAANGGEYWRVDKLRQVASETAAKHNHSLDDKVRELTAGAEEAEAEGSPETPDPDAVVEDYWRRVESNLRSGKVRLVFVTEEAPKELRRLVGFLNEKMSDVTCFILEIKQFLHEGKKHTALVPTVVVGPKETIEPSPTPADHLDEETFLARCKPEAGEFFRAVLSDAKHRRELPYWGTKSFSVRAQLPNGRLASFAYGWLSGEFQFYFPQLQLSEEQTANLREKLLAFKLEQGGPAFRRTSPSGKTLTAVVNAESTPELVKAWHFILEWVDAFLREHGAPPPKTHSE